MQLKGNIIILVGKGGGAVVRERERDRMRKRRRERKERRGGGGIGGRAQRKSKIEPISPASYRMAQALFLQSGAFSPLNS